MKNKRNTAPQSDKDTVSEKKYVARRKRDIEKEKKLAEESSVFFVTSEEIVEEIPAEPTEIEKKLDAIMQKSADRRSKRQQKLDEQQAALDKKQAALDARYKKREDKIKATEEKQLCDLAEYRAILEEKNSAREQRDKAALDKAQAKLEKLRKRKGISRTRINEEHTKLERLQRKSRSKNKKCKENIKASVAAEQSKIDKDIARLTAACEKSRAKAQARLDEIQADINAQQARLDEQNRKHENKVRTGLENKQAKEEAKIKKHDDKVQAKLDYEQAKADKKLADEKSRKNAELTRLKERTTYTPRTDTDDPEAIAEYMKKVEEIQSWNDKFSAIMLRIGVCVFALLVVLVILWNTEVAKISLEGKESYNIGINVFGMASSIRDVGTKAILKEEKVEAGSAGVVVFRLIDDMYDNPSDGTAYGDGEIILIGVYGAKSYTSVFENSDFSIGRADMQVRRATKADYKKFRKTGVSIARCTLIREYTEKEGGEYESNFEKLKDVSLKELIYREKVTQEATQAVEDIFGIFTTGNDVPVVITDGSTPAPTITPAAAPVAAQQPAQRTTTRNTTSTVKKQPTPAPTKSTQATAQPTAAATPKAATPAPTVKPVEPIREVARPTANPVGE